MDKTSDIPCDYSGLMGVPITFMDKYSPDQFEILGLSRDMDLPNKTGISAEFLEKYYAQGGTGQMTPGHPDLCYYGEGGKCVVPYHRIPPSMELVFADEERETDLRRIKKVFGNSAICK